MSKQNCAKKIFNLELKTNNQTLTYQYADLQKQVNELKMMVVNKK
jgi:hypothetical protein